MEQSVLSGHQRDELVAAIRATVGEDLRSVTYFTEDTVDQLYRRSDLEQTADLAGFAAMERRGFDAQTRYANTQLGVYQFTIRVFEWGYLTRVIDDSHGIWVTTDHMSIDRFEELAVAIRSILRSIDGPTDGSC